MRRLSIVPLAGALISIFLVHVPAGEAATETVLYSFAGPNDGATPVAGVIKPPSTSGQGTLYGTTRDGGTSTNCTNGCGTVFSFDLDTGTEAILHSFGNGSDGSEPLAGLINIGGALYGVTADGGTHGYGAVFSLDLSTGTETVLHSFGNGTDGRYPGDAALINVNGTLYGTTQDGGTGTCSAGCGTVFSINPSSSGSYAVVYSFSGGADGQTPDASLINVNGTLYGTTSYGGGGTGGTVFSINLATGTEAVVYSFCSQFNCSDGASPNSNLIEVSGKLYGTTVLGGTGSCGDVTCGTVFKVNPATGAETVLYSFGGGNDGAQPAAGLLNVNGTLYGTTTIDGNSGYGTVFSFDLATGIEAVVHSFGGQPDGIDPHASLINAGGTFYSTTVSGGTRDWGTVFKLTP